MAVLERYEASASDLKWFTPLCAALLGGWGGWRWWVAAPTQANVLWAVAGVLLAVHFLLPSLRRPFFDLCMTLAYPIGWVVSHLLLAAVYYLLITPIALSMRAMGRDPLKRRFDRAASSYWIARPSASAGEPTRYLKQF